MAKGPLGVSLAVGPVLGRGGSPVPDGTVVTVQSGDGAYARGWTVDGTAVVDIVAGHDSRIWISVGGYVVEVRT